MGNQVALDETKGIIRKAYIGEQNAATINQSAAETYPLADKLRSEGRPVLIMADISQVGRTGPGTREAGREMYKRLEYHKIAVFGGNAYTKKLLKAAITMLRLKNIQHFNSAAEAEDWLLS